MPIPAGGLLLQVLLIGELHSQTTNNYFHFMARNTAAAEFGDVITECRNLLIDFEGQIVSLIRQYASQEWVARALVGVTMVPRHAFLLEHRIAEGGGFQTGEALPTFAAGLLSLRTGRGGRSGHGRLYLAGATEDTSSASRNEASGVGQLATIGDALLARYGVNGTHDKFIYGLYSRKLGDDRQPGPPPFIEHHTAGFMNIIEIVPRVDLATMRKRKRGRGQ